MPFFFDSFMLDMVSALVLVTTAMYIYFSWSWTYWKKLGVPQLETHFPTGNFRDLFLVRKNIGYVYKDLYHLAKGLKFVGIYTFTRPVIMFRDPELIKAVLVKDFNNFQDRGFYDDSDREPLFGHLFLLSGQKWRNLRVKISPTFTSGKMKMMFPTLVQTGMELTECLEKPAANGEVIEVKDILARYSTDIISSCAFGIQCNCLKDPDAEFRHWGRRIFAPTFGSTLFFIFSTLSPTVLDLAKFMSINFFDPEVATYFKNMVRETVSYRENNNISRNDFMQLMIQLKNEGLVDVDLDKEEKKALEKLSGDVNYKLSTVEIAAQVFVFFIAGFETSSTTMAFCLYELCLRPNIQHRLQEEIDFVLAKHNGQVTYEAINEMEYLDKVVAETLRKYPPVPILNRVVTAPYQIPETDVILQKGISVVIPILALQNDPEYFPNPDVFDPERFSEKEKAKRHHYTYLPFGEGPRICIGMRFGQLQTKVGLVSVLSRYSLQVSEKTPIPLVMDPRAFILAATSGMWLRITKRNDTK